MFILKIINQERFILFSINIKAKTIEFIVCYIY